MSIERGPGVGSETALRRWRGFFVLAGLLNVAGGAWGYWHPGAPFADAGLPPPRYPFALELLFAAVFILGLGYFLVAYRPLEHRGIVAIGFLTKVAGAAITWGAVADGQLPESARLQPLVVDVPWAIGFLLFLIWSRGRPHGVGASSPQR